MHRAMQLGLSMENFFEQNNDFSAPIILFFSLDVTIIDILVL